MVLLSRFCCWRSVRKGSFVSGFFTLTVYLVLLVTSVFHVSTAARYPELLALNLSCLAVSLMCVVSSVLLLVGLTVDNRLLLLPWVVSISAATLLELTACFYHIPDVIKHPWLATLFCVDLLFCLLCVYCILCVISQYQQYLSGRGRAGQTANCPPIPIVQFQPSSCPSQPLASISGHVAQRGGGLLAVPSSSVSPQHTDLSSVSDDPSSSRGVVYHVG